MRIIVFNPKTMAEDPEMGFITHLKQYGNDLGSDQGQPERYIMMQLARNISNDPVFREQALLATMWLRDDHAFWAQLGLYMDARPNAPLPRYVQEAAYLFSQIDHQVDVSNLPIDPGIKENFTRFMQMAQQYEGADMKLAREEMYPFFGDTYYYDYYLMTNL